MASSIFRYSKIVCFLFFFAFCGTLRIYPSDVKEDHTQKKFNSIGFAIGTGFGSPWFIANVHGTFSPNKFFVIEPGMDFGLWHQYETRTYSGYANDILRPEVPRDGIAGIFSDSEVKYHSFWPYIHLSTFPWVAEDEVLLYAGLGFGNMFAVYSSADGREFTQNAWFMDFFGSMYFYGFDCSLTFRTGFRGFPHVKIQFGYTYRFR
jgi:hypothetical protein